MRGTLITSRTAAGSTSRPVCSCPFGARPKGTFWTGRSRRRCSRAGRPCLLFCWVGLLLPFLGVALSTAACCCALGRSTWLGVWPTVRLGMLEAASPRGCRGELVPRGSSETDCVPLAPWDLTGAGRPISRKPARCRIASNHLPASHGHLVKAPGAVRRPNPWFENTCDFGVWPAPEIRLPSYSGPPQL